MPLTPEQKLAKAKEASRFPRMARASGDPETDLLLNILHRLERFRRQTVEAALATEGRAAAEARGHAAVSRLVTYIYTRICPSRPGRPRKTVPVAEWPEAKAAAIVERKG